VYGVDAMDLWIAEMSKVPWSEDPDEKGIYGADSTAWWVQVGSRAAAAYLRKTAPQFAEGAREHLGIAAEHYEQIVGLLDPAITGNSGEHYRGFMGDLGKQKAHVQTVLRPVREHLLRTAIEMEEAVAAELRLIGQDRSQ